MHRSSECRETTFEAWTKPEAFRLAHRDAAQNNPLYLDHPQSEGFEVIGVDEKRSGDVALRLSVVFARLCG